MANEIKLEAYTFQIRKKKETNKFFPLDDFFKGEDFFNLFVDYSNELGSLKTFDLYQKAIRLKSGSLIKSSKNRTIRGIFESGAYGYETSIVDNLSEKIVHQKQKTHTEIIPFYFLIYIPEKMDVGFIFLQRFGVFGISTIFNASFKNFMNSKFEDYIVDFNAHVSQQLADTFLNSGNIKEVVLRRMSLPTDIADKLNMTSYIDDVHSMEIRIKSKRNRSLGGRLMNAKSFLKDQNAKFFDIPAMRDIGFDGAHSISVVSKVNGNTRTIDLSDTGNIRPYYDIDKDVKIQANGFPTFDSIDKAALDLLEDFK